MSLSSKLIPSLLASAVCASLALVADVSVASGGPSGPAVAFRSTGNIGEVIVNPYKVSPLTAVIRNGGYEIHNAVVRIVRRRAARKSNTKWAIARSSTTAAFPCSAFMQTTSIR